MGTIIDSAVEWAMSVANDDTHGYDQSDRWGPDYDCSSLIITAYEQAGVPVKANGASYTGDMVNAFKSCGFKDITSSVKLDTGAGLKRGDVVWMKGHCELVCSDGTLVGASSNENGGATGGLTGDQTGTEIRVRAYYNGPWSVVLRYTSHAIPSNWISKNAYLSDKEMQNNALMVWSYFGARGWSLEAVAAMLGNMQDESTINPGIWESLEEYGRGYGLVQWTPYTKYSEWAGAGWQNNGNKQCERIQYEVDNNIQWFRNPEAPIVDPPVTFKEFTQSTADVGTLANYFLWYYEHPAVTIQDERAAQARRWYEYLSDVDPSPTPTTPKKNKRIFFNSKWAYLIMVTRRRRI